MARIMQLLQLAKRDINTARRNLEDAPDWAYSIAYNSILQASRALMFFTGYRPRGGEQHATVVEFIEERLGSTFEGQVKLFDQMRRKRHRVIYEASGLVSRKEAEQAIEFAEKFVGQITEMITGQSRLGI
jgi:uncharacterized protein (UPF0332 family)